MAHTNYISTMMKEMKQFGSSAPSSKAPSPEASPAPRELETLNESSGNRVGGADTPQQKLLSEMEKLEFGAAGRKLPRLKLGRGSSRGEWSTRARHGASLSGLLKKKKVEDDPELARVEDAKDKAIAEAKRLGEEARKAQLEVHMLTRELEELKREQAVEMNTRSALPAGGGKRWDSEKLTIRFANRVLKSSDYTMDVQDKGSKIAINLHINGMMKPSS
jgi:hypothetical protein